MLCEIYFLSFAETENKQDFKPRRAYSSGRITSLYPFPRSGRGDPDFLELDRIARMHGVNIDNIKHEGRNEMPIGKCIDDGVNVDESYAIVSDVIYYIYRRYMYIDYYLCKLNPKPNVRRSWISYVIVSYFRVRLLYV